MTQHNAETALNTPQMEAQAGAQDLQGELRRLQARMERFRHTGDQSPAAQIERNALEAQYNDLWVRLRDQGRA